MVTVRLKGSSSKYVFTLDVKMFSLESSLRCFGVFLCCLLNCISNKHVNRKMTVVLQRDLQSRYSAAQERKKLNSFSSLKHKIFVIFPSLIPRIKQ